MVTNAVWTAIMKWGCKMRRSELIARLNSLRHDLERKNHSLMLCTNYDLETVEACLYYFIDHEDADPHWE